MWGTDATRFYTERDGWCWFFGAVDHYTTEVMGWHVAKLGDRWAALEPIRQGLTIAFGTIAPKVALGVALRHDWGSQYTANTFVNEIKCWGFTDTPAAERELKRVQAKVGELTMKLEIVEWFLEKKATGRS